MSTDPAHSLSDSLGQEIGDRIKEVKGVKNLKSFEINAEKAYQKFKVEYEKEIKRILNTFNFIILTGKPDPLKDFGKENLFNKVLKAGTI